MVSCQDHNCSSFTFRYTLLHIVMLYLWDRVLPFGEGHFKEIPINLQSFSNPNPCYLENFIHPVAELGHPTPIPCIFILPGLGFKGFEKKNHCSCCANCLSLGSIAFHQAAPSQRTLVVSIDVQIDCSSMCRAVTLPLLYSLRVPHQLRTIDSPPSQWVGLKAKRIMKPTAQRAYYFSCTAQARCALGESGSLNQCSG